MSSSIQLSAVLLSVVFSSFNVFFEFSKLLLLIGLSIIAVKLALFFLLMCSGRICRLYLIASLATTDMLFETGGRRPKLGVVPNDCFCSSINMDTFSPFLINLTSFRAPLGDPGM